MKFTTLSTAPFINLLVALLLHNPSSSIVAANEDAFSFSTTATTDNNAVESVIDLNQRRSLGKGSDKKVLLPEKLAEKMMKYLDQDLNCKGYNLSVNEDFSVTLTDVRSLVDYVLAPNKIVEVNTLTLASGNTYEVVWGLLPPTLVAQRDVYLPEEELHEKCEKYKFGFEGEFTDEICAARKKVVAMCAEEPTICNKETFDESFLIRAAKSSYLSNKTTVGKLACEFSAEPFDCEEETGVVNYCKTYKYDDPNRDSDDSFNTIDENVDKLNGLVNACLPEGFNNPLLSAGAVYRGQYSFLERKASGKKLPIFRISDGWLSLNKQVIDKLNKNEVYWNLLIKSTVMRLFANNWIDEKQPIDYFEDTNLRRRFENEVMASYLMEKHSKDILTQKEKKHMFKFTDFEQFIDCASHLGAKLANEECDTEAAFEKAQSIAAEVDDSQLAILDMKASESICEKYFDEKQRKNWRKYAKKVMDKTMTSKCNKKTGKKSPNAEKKSRKRLRKD